MTNLTPMGRARNFYAWKNSSGGGKKKTKKKKRGELLCVRCMFLDGDFRHNCYSGRLSFIKKIKKNNMSVSWISLLPERMHYAVISLGGV